MRELRRLKIIYVLTGVKSRKVYVKENFDIIDRFAAKLVIRQSDFDSKGDI